MSDKATKKQASLFELDGVPSFGKAFPLSLQHVVAMIVGCVIPGDYYCRRLRTFCS